MASPEVPLESFYNLRGAAPGEVPFVISVYESPSGPPDSNLPSMEHDGYENGRHTLVVQPPVRPGTLFEWVILGKEAENISIQEAGGVEGSTSTFVVETVCNQVTQRPHSARAAMVADRLFRWMSRPHETGDMMTETPFKPEYPGGLSPRPNRLRY